MHLFRTVNALHPNLAWRTWSTKYSSFGHCGRYETLCSAFIHFLAPTICCLLVSFFLPSASRDLSLCFTVGPVHHSCQFPRTYDRMHSLKSLVLMCISSIMISCFVLPWYNSPMLQIILCDCGECEEVEPYRVELHSFLSNAYCVCVCIPFFLLSLSNLMISSHLQTQWEAL